jgi:CRISPR-associated protein Cmr4
MMTNLTYLYLLSPLHTGGTTQEGNLLGIARESHTTFPYIPSSSIRGRLRASFADQSKKFQLFGNEIESGESLTQGDLWIGDGSILWIPIPSLSHGVIWISCPLLLQRWARFHQPTLTPPAPNQANLDVNKPVYLKDAIFKPGNLQNWRNWKAWIPQHSTANSICRVLVLSDRDCATLIQMGLWRQVKVKLNEHKTVEGGFRYEEAIPPDTLMFFPWGTTTQANGTAESSRTQLQDFLTQQQILQIGGQESLGRGFVQAFSTQAQGAES